MPTTIQVTFHGQETRSRFEKWARKQLRSDLSIRGINYEPGRKANDYISFTRYYSDLDLGIPDTISNLTMLIVSPLLEEASKELKAKSMSSLAEPYIKIEVQRNAPQSGLRRDTLPLVCLFS